MKILLVEDEPKTANSVRRELQDLSNFRARELCRDNLCVAHQFSVVATTGGVKTRPRGIREVIKRHQPGLPTG